MEKYITKHLNHLVSHDDSWKIYNFNNKPSNEFFLLFNFFKPIDNLIKIPENIKNTNTNIIFVHKGLTPIMNLKIENTDVKNISFDVDKKLIEPFAVYIKDFNLIKNGDEIKDILEKLIKTNHIIIDV